MTSPTKTIPLPVSKAEFARRAALARTDDALGALFEQAEHECKEAARAFLNGRSLPRTASLRRYEERLLVLIAKPRPSRDFRRVMPIWNAQSRTWQALIHLGSAKARRLALRQTKHGDKYIRSHAYHCVARMGVSTDFPMLRKAMKSGDPLLIESIAGAVYYLHYFKHAPKPYVEQLLALLITVLAAARTSRPPSDNDESAYSKVCDAITRVRGNRTEDVLGSPDALHPHNPALRMILLKFRSLAEDGWKPTRIQASTVWPVFEAAREGKIKGRRGFHVSQIMQESLVLAAHVDPIRARREVALLRKTLKKDDWALSDALARATRACKAVPEASALVHKHLRGKSRLSTDATCVLRAWELADHVNHDGLSLYYHNCGEHWQQAAKGLRLIGASRAESMLTKHAAIAFGGARAAQSIKTSAAAQTAYSKLHAGDLETLEAAYDTFEPLCQTIYRGVEQYIGRHAAKFKA